MVSSTTFSTSTATYATSSETSGMFTAPTTSATENEFLRSQLQAMAAQMEELMNKINDQARQILDLRGDLREEVRKRGFQEERMEESNRVQTYTHLLELQNKVKGSEGRQDHLELRLSRLEGIFLGQEEAIKSHSQPTHYARTE